MGLGVASRESRVELEVWRRRGRLQYYIACVRVYVLSDYSLCSMAHYLCTVVIDKS